MSRPGYKICPVCAEEIREAAKMCRFCGAVLTDEPLPQIISIRTPPRPQGAPLASATMQEIQNTAREDFERRGVELTAQSWKRIEKILSRAEDQYRETTALFIDVSNYTRLFGKMPTEEIKTALERLYDLCAHEIGLHNGFIVKFIGDAVLAVFGAPVAYDRDVESAVRAALAIREGADLLPALRGNRLQIRAGLDIGVVVTTVIRATGRADFDLFGEPINIAQRLQSQAEPGQVIVSGAVWRQVRHVFETRPLGALTLKNVSEPVEAFQVERLREGILVRRDFSAPFFGREREQQWLAERMDRAVAGKEAVFAAIRGEGGIGKTRLVWEALQGQLDQVRLLRVECETHGAKIPFHALTGILRELFEIPSEMSSEQTRQRIEEYFAAHPVLEPDQVALLHYLFSVAPRGSEGIPASALRRSLLAACLALVKALTEDKPLAIWVDDFQWVDPSTVEFIAELARNRDTLNRLLVILTHRDTFQLPAELQAVFEETALKSLPQRDRLALLSWLVNQEPLGTEIRDTLLRKAGGNPLFLQETARTVLRLWEESDDRTVPAEICARIEAVIPDSLRGLIQARIDALEQRARLALQCGAVLGTRFTLGVVELFEMIREGLLERLYVLRGLQFLHSRPTPSDLEFIFYHGLTQEVAYQSLLEEHRRELHGLIAEQLERKFSENETLESNSSVLAYHYLRSSHREKALRWVVESARQAARIYSNVEALDLYEQALMVLEGLPPTEANRRTLADVLRARGRLLRLAGHLDEADECFRSLLSAAQDLDDARLCADAWAETGMTLYQRGRIEESDDWLVQAAETYEIVADSAGVAMAFNSLGMNALARGHLDRALEWLDRAANEDIEADKPAIAADIHNNRGLVLWRQAKYQPALESIRRAQAIWQRVHNRFGLCATTLNVGLLEENLGHLRPALENYRNALVLAQKMFYREAEATILVNLGNALRRKGDLRQATDTNSKALEAARKLGRNDIAATALKNLALAALAAHRDEQSILLFNEGLETVGATGDPERRASLLLGRTRAELALGRIEAARADFTEASRIISETKCAALEAPRHLTAALLQSYETSVPAHAEFKHAIEAALATLNPWDEYEALQAWQACCKRFNDSAKAAELESRIARMREGQS